VEKAVWILDLGFKSMEPKRLKITPAVYLYLVKNNKILLLRRYQTGFKDGQYSFAAGHLQIDETVKQAMVREAGEEADINLKIKNLDIVHVMSRREKHGNIDLRERVDFFIKPKDWSGQPKNMEPHKCDDLSWFNLNNLPTNTIPYIRQAIDCIQNKIFFSEFGWD